MRRKCGIGKQANYAVRPAAICRGAHSRKRLHAVLILLGLRLVLDVRIDRDVGIHKITLFGCGRFQFALDNDHQDCEEDGARRNKHGIQNAGGDHADNDRRGGAQDGTKTKDVLQNSHNFS